MEIFVGGLVGLATYGIYTMADRYIATRDTALVKSPSAPIYKDWMRIALGVGGSAIPIVIAHFVRSPVGRSSLQFAGLAVLFGFGGKLIEDVGAMLLKDNDTGKRLFAGEIFAQDALAQAEKSSATPTGGAGLPAGAGKPQEHVPPPPAVFNGQPSPGAVAVVKKHHVTLTALGSIAPHLAAHASGRATAEQLQQIEHIRVTHAEGLSELSKYEEAELKAAAGLAGLTPQRESAITPPVQQKPQQKPLVAPQFGWANNGEKDAA